MRIVYLHQYFRTPAMTGGTRSYEMARRLVARGHEVDLITACDSGVGRGWRESVEAGIRVHWCEVPYSNHLSHPARIRAFLKFSWRAARRAAAIDADLVFATSTPLTIALPAVWAARRRRIPMVFEVRDLWPEMPIAIGALRNPLAIAAARQLERFAYRHAARVVALSSGMRSGVIAAGYPADRVTVIPNSCDFDLFAAGRGRGDEFRREHAWLGDRPLVLYAGTLGQINGVDYLARVAAAAAQIDPEVRFLVVGSGREEECVRRVARELGVLDQNFFMLPPRPKAEMPALYAAADVAASVFLDIPQMWANSANKVFDALAAGRPIAINHGGWLADMVRQTGCGVVLDACDAESAAAALVPRLANPQWLRRAGQAAARVGRERFDRDVLADQLEDVLLAACGRDHRVRRKVLDAA